MLKASDLQMPIQPKRIKLITLNEEFLLKFGALKLYGDFLCEWLYAKAIWKSRFYWRWGKCRIEVEVSEGDYQRPIMTFEEFNAILQSSYYRVEFDMY